MRIQWIKTNSKKFTNLCLVSRRLALRIEGSNKVCSCKFGSEGKVMRRLFSDFALRFDKSLSENQVDKELHMTAVVNVNSIAYDALIWGNKFEDRTGNFKYLFIFARIFIHSTTSQFWITGTRHSSVPFAWSINSLETCEWLIEQASMTTLLKLNLKNDIWWITTLLHWNRSLDVRRMFDWREPWWSHCWKFTLLRLVEVIQPAKGILVHH